MKVTLATICEYASQRDGLFTIVSAGISTTQRPSYPASLGFPTALTLTDQRENLLRKEVTVSVTLRHSGSLEPIAGVAADLVRHQGEEDGGFPPTNVHIVLPTSGFEVPEPGDYVLDVELDDKPCTQLPIQFSLAKEEPEEGAD